VFGSAAVPPEDAPYRLEVSAKRAEHSAWATTLSSETAWTFRSARPAAGTAALPLLDLDYRLGLDELNRARADRSHAVSIGARLVGAERSVKLRSLALDVTYDDGETWREARTWTRGDEGWAQLRHPRRTATNGFAGLRVRAEDGEGNAIEQTTLRAFALR
jgi:hypothetical protein